MCRNSYKLLGRKYFADFYISLRYMIDSRSFCMIIESKLLSVIRIYARAMFSAANMINPKNSMKKVKPYSMLVLPV